MGALSPATRNAQVAMFQRGEVDYLVATDAIGMGLNMDVAHVAFAASATSSIGKADRRLSTAEMAQIAGRAGRHQRDGTFGTLGLTDETGGFSENEIAAIEEHRFRPLDFVYWRNASLDFSDVRTLIGSLEKKPDDPVLRAAPEAIDLAVLKLVAEDPSIASKKERSQARRTVRGRLRPSRLPQSRPNASQPDGQGDSTVILAKAAMFPTNGSLPKSPGSIM